MVSGCAPTLPPTAGGGFVQQFVRHGRGYQARILALAVREIAELEDFLLQHIATRDKQLLAIHGPHQLSD